LPEIVGGKPVADRQTKDIDHLVSMRADEMGTEDAPAALFGERLKAVDPLGDTARRVR
jgi:hypothetical protein